MRVAIHGFNNYSKDLIQELDKLGAVVFVFPFSEEVSNDTQKYKFQNPDSRIFKDFRVLQVGKKYLTKSEVIQGHSRMYDLFRVIYKSCMKFESIPNEETTHSSQTFDTSLIRNSAEEKLMQDFEESLALERDEYIDVDFFVTTCNKNNGEQVFIEGPIVNLDLLYQQKFIQDSKVLGDEIGGINQPALTGFSKVCLLEDHYGCENAANLILANKKWLFELENTLHIVSSKSQPFSDLKSKNIALYVKLMAFLDELEDFLNESFEEHRQKVFQQRQLQGHNEPMVKLPGSKSQGPNETLAFHLGFSPLIVDKLYDRTELFLTIEKPLFRGKHELKTIGSELIIVGTDKGREIGSNVKDSDQHHVAEPGFYYSSQLNDNFSVCEDIVLDMGKYFSKT